jgi:hypothetical protein
MQIACWHTYVFGHPDANDSYIGLFCWRHTRGQVLVVLLLTTTPARARIDRQLVAVLDKNPKGRAF